MAKNGLSSGKKLDVVAGGTVSSGEIKKVGDIHGVASQDAESGDTYVLNLDGEYKVPKVAGGGTGGSQGAKAYVKTDSGELKVTADDEAAANDLVGWFTEDAADGDTEAKVTFNQMTV